MHIITIASFLISALLKASADLYAARVVGLTSVIGSTAAASHGSADFGTLLRNRFMTNSESGHTPGDSYTQFFRFGDSKSIYNMYDAGNFMWGAWMRINHYPLIVARAGAHDNNFISTILGLHRSGGVKNSDEDQRAIRNGYNYGKY